MSIFSLSFLGILGFMVSMLALSLQYKHFLSVLLSLECGMMFLFFLMLGLCSSVSFMGYASLVFISLSCCEASLGLSMLVMGIRCKGNDYVSSFCSQKC